MRGVRWGRFGISPAALSVAVVVVVIGVVAALVAVTSSRPSDRVVATGAGRGGSGSADAPTTTVDALAQPGTEGAGPDPSVPTTDAAGGAATPTTTRRATGSTSPAAGSPSSAASGSASPSSPSSPAAPAGGSRGSGVPAPTAPPAPHPTGSAPWGPGLYVLDLQSMVFTQLASGQVMSSSWSPDGTRVAYTLFGGSQTDSGATEVAALAGGRTRLHDGASKSPPSWDPTGALVASVRPVSTYDHDAFVTPADGSGPPRQLAQAGADNAAAFGSNGQLAVGGEHGIHISGADGSNRRKLTSDPVWYGDIDWSRDATRVGPIPAVSSGQRRHYDAASGSHVDLCSASASDYRIDWTRWAPDGSRLVAAGYQKSTNTFGTWLLPADGGPATLLQASDDDPDWSPDGSRIAAADQDDWSLVTMKADGSDRKVLHTGGAGNRGLRHPHYSPDGTKLTVEILR